MRRKLPAAAADLIEQRGAELDEITERLLSAGPLEPDPWPPLRPEGMD